MADKGGLTFLPGATEANVAYEEALKRLTESLDARKNRLFDPTLLAMAEGFLGPTQTGSFAESLGKAVGKYRGAVLEEEKTAQEIAKAQMGLAQQRMEIERQKRMADIAQRYFGGQEPQVTFPGAPGEPAEVSQRGAPRGTYESDPAANFIQLAIARGMDPAEIEKEAIKIRQGATQVVEGGAYNRMTGRFEPFGIKNVDIDIAGQRISVPAIIAVEYKDLIKNKRFKDAVKLITDFQSSMQIPTEAQLAGSKAEAEAGGRRGQEFKMETVQLPLRGGGTGGFEIAPEDAFRFQQIVRQHGINSPQALEFAGKFTGESAPLGGAAPAQPSVGGAQPAAEAPAEARPRLKSASERAAESAAAEEAAKLNAKIAAEREANLSDVQVTAVEMEGITNRISRIVDESGRFVGIFAKPGLGPAMLGLIQDSVRTGKGGVVEVPTLENAVRKIMPGVKKSDISNIEKAQADLSNLELLYRKAFLKGQGAVSNMESQVVARLGGSTATTPETLVHRMNLIRAKAQFDKSDVEAFSQWKERNPTKNYIEWKSTPQYQQLVKTYDQKLNEVEQNYIQQQGAPVQQKRPTWNPKTKSWEF